MCVAVIGPVLVFASLSKQYSKHPGWRQQVCAHMLTVAPLGATCKSMEMARDRKPVNLSLDPDLVDRLRSWCKAQDVEVALARAVDKAISEFLEARNAD